MSQTNQSNQQNQPNQPNQSSRGSLRTLGIIGLVLITILSLTFAGYTTLNPHTTTLTQQQLLTNTQSFTSTLTATNTLTVTSSRTITSTATSTMSAGYGYGDGYYPSYPYYQDCGWSCPPSSGYVNNYNACNINNLKGANNTVQCFGYVYQNSDGCVVLAVPLPNPPYYFENPVTQYFGLHNSPSNSPPMGTWVTVTGHWNQGPNTSPSGTACPFNYINVTSITQ